MRQRKRQVTGPERVIVAFFGAVIALSAVLTLTVGRLYWVPENSGRWVFAPLGLVIGLLIIVLAFRMGNRF